MQPRHFLVLLVLALFTSPLVAQERYGGLTGIVTDSTKAVVPGATVTITNKTTGVARTVVTGTDGSYRLQDLEPGRYSVAIELQGFEKVVNDDVIVLLGRVFDVSAELKPGAQTETVNVTGADKQIDLKTTTLAHNVTAEELDRLPKARSFQSIALAAPGVNSGEIEAGFTGPWRQRRRERVHWWTASRPTA